MVAGITGLVWVFTMSNRKIQTTKTQSLIRNAVLLLAFFEIFPAVLQTDLGLFTEIGSQWLALILVFWFILGITEREEQIPKLLIVLLVAVAWVMFQAQMTYSYAFSSLPEGRLGAYGMYRGANDYGLILTCSIPLLLKLAEYYKSRVLRVALYAMVPFCLFHIYLTASRGSVIGSTVALLLCVRTKSGLSVGWRKVSTIIIASVMILTGLTMIASHRGDESLGASDDSAQSRLDAWAASGRMLLANPLGVGFDQSREFIKEYGMDQKIYPHNTYVKVAAEAGIAGFIALVIMLYVTLSRLMKLEYYYRKVVPDKKVAIIQALLFSLIAFMINTSFSQKEYEWLFYILLACSARLISFESKVIEGTVES
jgi:O-antigen ligase